MQYSQSTGNVPKGGIIMWSGSHFAIPPGFLICDGTGKTPDLRNRFVIGVGDTYITDDTGGEQDHILTIGELAAHTHNVGVSNTAGASATIDQQGGASAGNVASSSVGSGTGHNNMPPYYALAYIMRD